LGGKSLIAVVVLAATGASCAAPAVVGAQWAFLGDRDDVLPPTFNTEPPPRPAPPSPPEASPPLALPRRVDPAPLAADRRCLRMLRDRGVDFVSSRPVRGVRTPVEIVGRLDGARLIPRVARPPLMDCELALALVEMGPVFRSLGITGLSFSGAYDYRTIRGSHRLSAHAHGLAIDVHAVETRSGDLDVAADYPRDRARWRGLEPGPTALAQCLGRPKVRAGRVLRALACRLRGHPAVRVLLTPDDNADHANHLHIETYPERPGDLYSGVPPRGKASEPGVRSREEVLRI
jgi:hypothetical protein